MTPPDCTCSFRGVPPEDTEKAMRATNACFFFVWAFAGLLLGFTVGLCLVIPFYLNRPLP